MPIQSRNAPPVQGGGSGGSSASFYLAQDNLGGFPYFALPQSVLGNQVKSYGGYLMYGLTYNGRQINLNEPDILVIVCIFCNFEKTKNSC
jgi:hypothetical protein